LEGDPNVTIADFKYSPSPITIHVGDQITWTNNDPIAHTATANDGSFNTGSLSKGASASHTFTEAGTFTYYCKIHPFMHGTIVVLAAASSTTATSTTNNRSTASAASTGATTPTSTTSNQPSTTTQASSQLPFTGLDLTAAVLSGLLLIALGVTIRRVNRAR
jgi:uncharacterized surface anchored protein